MSELVQHVENVSCKHQKKIQSLIDPLASIYNVNAHAYYRIDSQGFLTLLCNFPEISKFYFANNLHLNNPFLKHPDLINPGFLLASGIEDDSFQEAQSKVEENHQLHNLLLIFQKEGDTLHAHGFATTQQKNITNLYLNHMDRFRLYCDFFRKETLSLLRPINYAKIVGKSFYEKCDPRKDLETQRKHFHWMNSKNDPLNLFKPLTDREIDCLKLLLEGLSASQISEHLSITTRTAEHHIDHIKDKLLCTTKSEIFSFVANLKKSGGDLFLLQESWSHN